MDVDELHFGSGGQRIDSWQDIAIEDWSGRLDASSEVVVAKFNGSVFEDCNHLRQCLGRDAVAVHRFSLLVNGWLERLQSALVRVIQRHGEVVHLLAIEMDDVDRPRIDETGQAAKGEPITPMSIRGMILLNAIPTSWKRRER